jgi:hypothetical protein
MKKSVKKFALVGILTLFLGVLAACGSSDTIEANQEFLEDLDYMLYVLQENFGLFDVAYWAHGADINAIAGNIRAEILADPGMSLSDFYVTLVRNFRPAQNIGHLSFITPGQHSEHAGNFSSWWTRFFSPAAFRRASLPHVRAFYESRDDSVIPYYDRLASSELMYGRIAGLLRWYGEYAAADEFMQALADRHWESAVQILITEDRLRNTPPFVHTEIIEADKIAYLRIDTLWHFIPPNAMQDFFYEIRDYEHLIIDLRYTAGGDPMNFIRPIILPNISGDLRVSGFAFVAHGMYAAPYVAAPLNMLDNVISARGQVLRPIEDVLNEFNLPEFNMADAERLDYGLQIELFQRGDSNEPAFGGRVWMLTGPDMYSGAQISAWVAKESGFATLVGSRTGGVYGGPRTLVALPHSGILFQMDLLYITDSRGRPLEAGTIPHYFNRPGMDALETVLAMIAEGQY